MSATATYVASLLIALSSVTIAGLVVACFWAALPARSNELKIDLEYSPNHITIVEIVRLIVLLLLKTLITGFTPPLKPAEQVAGTFDLPQIEVRGKLRVEDDQIKTFRKALHQEDSDEFVNPLFLFTQLNPLVVLLLAHRECPINPLGAVNTRNTFDFLDPRPCCDVHTLKTASQDGSLTYIACFGAEPGTRRAKGVEFSIVIELFLSEKLVMRSKMWFLQFLPRSYMPADTQALKAEHIVHKQDLLAAGLPRSTFAMTPKDPGRWAASCKDYNPIHISRLAAKLLGGYGNVIAHGNHVLATIIQQREKQAEATRQSNPWRKDQSIELTVQFRSPMVLPAPLCTIWSEAPLAAQEFIVLGRHDKEHMRGKISLRAVTPPQKVSHSREYHGGGGGGGGIHFGGGSNKLKDPPKGPQPRSD